ncbi:FAD:protein FMN transferase [Jatrophihabitans telluris]|uniref:FAD:protein FMN transferase n=1 Tax=Jatrophihabitans telluris TaxID=2038343 RepID=A0ABY4QWQ9_9ACTN|nr:FAD:protein FMN transferase [Jatrophihabitans telluris]UQX87384.1 FAD:protein FMN transferase [Jatrophihabitans telluris]
MRATDLPTLDRRWAVVPPVHRFTAMASRISVQLPTSSPDPAGACSEVEEIFSDVERRCSRFDPDSDLSRLNRHPGEWVVVSATCFEAVHEAFLAHRATGGRFDPRVLTSLLAIGYNRSFAFTHKPERTDPVTVDLSATATAASGWAPDFDPDGSAIRLGSHPIDLGGIGKGFALRRARQALVRRRAAESDWFLVEAGGDCVLGGDGPSGAGWSVGVEDPHGGADPSAVLRLSETSCATSSVRHRSWRAGDRPVHHIIDPGTGAPSRGGVLSVTVVDPDPARAEVTSKTLFLAGRSGIAAAAESVGRPAVWVDEAGVVAANSAAATVLTWRPSWP